MNSIRLEQIRTGIVRLSGQLAQSSNAVESASLKAKLLALYVEQDAFALLGGGARLSPVSTTTALGHLAYATLVDKADCFVEVAGAFYTFDAQAGSGDVAVVDLPQGATGYWKKVVVATSGATGSFTTADKTITVVNGLITTIATT